MIFESLGPPFTPPPENITIPQFMLDDILDHPTYLKRPEEIPCFIDEDNGQPVMIDELRSHTDSLARFLSTRYHVKPRDVVALVAPNHVHYAICVWAVHRLGGTVAAMNPSLNKEELVSQLKLANPCVVIGHLDNYEVVLTSARSIHLNHQAVLVLDGEYASSESSHSNSQNLKSQSIAQCLSEGSIFPPFVERCFLPGEARKEVAFLSFSSGTTGQPKAVAISHYNVMCDVLQTATFNRINEDYCDWADRRFRPGDVCTGVMPFYHIYGLVTNMHCLIYCGMTIVVAKKFAFEKLLQSISQYRITHLQIVPPMAVLLCKHPATSKYQLSSVRYCMIAAAPISAELTEEILSTLPGIHLGQGYGMTETCAAVSMFPITQRIGTLGSAGQLVSGTVAKVVKPDGSLGKVGERGELWVKGGQVVLGYYGNDEETRNSFVDGWYRSGDEVYFTANGDIFVTDRIKELIKTKGYQVAPAELEGHLLSHPDVADAGVIGVPDEYAGEVPRAYVVLKPEVVKRIAGDKSGKGRSGKLENVRKDIFKHVADAKSKYKWLTGGIEFVDAIPKSASGKILRRVLRERAKRDMERQKGDALSKL